jgi:hypothetical protein
VPIIADLRFLELTLSSLGFNVNNDSVSLLSAVEGMFKFWKKFTVEDDLCCWESSSYCVGALACEGCGYVLVDV